MSFFSLLFLFLHKIGEQEGGTGSAWGIWYQSGRGVWGKAVSGWIWYKYCVHKYVNVNYIWWNYFRTEGGGRWRRIMERVNASMIYSIYCKNFCKCHNVLPPSPIICKKCKKKKNWLWVILTLEESKPGEAGYFKLSKISYRLCILFYM
jgi:hypothetical protein